MRLSTVVAAVLLALIVPGVAEASPGGACFQGRVCLYAGFAFNRSQVDLWRDFVHDDTNLADDTWLKWDYTDSWHTMDNATSSARNRLGCPVTLWQNPHFTGAHSTLDHATGDGFLANNAIGNNRVSSLDIWCR
ncbi:peptidase inhibitor family I36 protein [Nonomuraea sp. NPDC050478]|uniref:peptidase inhibitor family I36 protein n=1 Tax=unclassified Nonomuraea TaxID=2593643 RepID=UPI0016505116|nr:peptidase inhibitor family I36 protein [Nonomuraea sp. C10]